MVDYRWSYLGLKSLVLNRNPDFSAIMFNQDLSLCMNMVTLSLLLENREKMEKPDIK